MYRDLIQLNKGDVIIMNSQKYSFVGYFNLDDDGGGWGVAVDNSQNERLYFKVQLKDIFEVVPQEIKDINPKNIFLLT